MAKDTVVGRGGASIHVEKEPSDKWRISLCVSTSNAEECYVELDLDGACELAGAILAAIAPR